MSGRLLRGTMIFVWCSNWQSAHCWPGLRWPAMHGAPAHAVTEGGRTCARAGLRCRRRCKMRPRRRCLRCRCAHVQGTVGQGAASLHEACNLSGPRTCLYEEKHKQGLVVFGQIDRRGDYCRLAGLTFLRPLKVPYDCQQDAHGQLLCAPLRSIPDIPLFSSSPWMWHVAAGAPCGTVPRVHHLPHALLGGGPARGLVGWGGG